MNTDPVSIDWHQWLRRWDAQKTGYLPHREARFTEKQQQADAFERRGVEDWSQWWSALAKEPGMSSLVAEREAERERRFADKPRDWAEPLLDLHEAGLLDAGFREVGVLWQHMDDRVVMAVR